MKKPRKPVPADTDPIAAYERWEAGLRYTPTREDRTRREQVLLEAMDRLATENPARWRGYRVGFFVLGVVVFGFFRFGARIGRCTPRRTVISRAVSLSRRFCLLCSSRPDQRVRFCLKSR